MSDLASGVVAKPSSSRDASRCPLIQLCKAPCYYVVYWHVTNPLIKLLLGPHLDLCQFFTGCSEGERKGDR